MQHRAAPRSWCARARPWAARAAPRTADVTVLAQASMAGAAERLQDLGIVLSSPGPGVQRIIERLHESTPV